MDNDMQKVFEKCIKRWGKNGIDDRIEDAIEAFNTNWINDEKIIEEKEIIVNLLEKFDYYSREDRYIAINELTKKLIEECEISDKDSIITIVKKEDGKSSSSTDYLVYYKNLHIINKNIFYVTLDELKKEWWENIEKVVFVDDCSGTGTQIINFLKKEMEKRSFVNKKIILALVVVMDPAIEYIREYAKENGLDIKIIWYCSKEKAYQDMSNEQREKIYELSQKRKITEKYIHGFKEAEALIAFNDNTPNDTIGIFWQKNKNNLPLFLREPDGPAGWKTNRNNKKRRKRQQYESKCRK